MPSPTIYTFKAIKQSIITRVQAYHTNSKWLDFYDNSIGTILIELVAGLETVMKKTVAAYRRETFLFSATSPASIISIASGVNGYSANRGQNEQYLLSVTFNTGVSLHPFTRIGSMSGKNVIYIGNTMNVNAGSTALILCTFGTLVQETLISQSSNIQMFRFSTPFSSTVRVKLTQANITGSSSNNPGGLGGLKDSITGVTLTGQPTPIAPTTLQAIPFDTQVVPYTQDFLLLTQEYYLAITNPSWSVDVMFLNQQQVLDTFDPTIIAIQAYKNLYAIGDKITVEGVVLENLVVNPSNINITGGVVDVALSQQVSPYLPREDNISIALKSSIYHETQSVVRGRLDQAKMLLPMNPKFIDTNYLDINPLQLSLSYSQVDDTFITASQKTQYLNDLVKFTIMGVLPPQIQDPTIEFVELTIDVYVTSTFSGNTTLESSLRSLWLQYERKLSQPFNPILLESDAILSDPNILQVRINSAILQPKATTDLILQAIDNQLVGTATSTRTNLSGLNSTSSAPINLVDLRTANAALATDNWWKTYYVFHSYVINII